MLIDYDKLLKSIKSSVWPRYSPKLHVELSISDLFEWICRSKKFYEDIRYLKWKLKKEIKSIGSESDNENIKNQFDTLYQLHWSLMTELDRIIEYENKFYNWELVQQKCNEITELLWELNDILRQEKEKIEWIKWEGKWSWYWYTRSPAEIINSKINDIYKIIDFIRSIKDYAESDKAILSNRPYLYIKWEAWSGKTHLLCDLFDKRTTWREKYDTIMVLWESFNDQEDIYSQIFNQCNIQKRRYENIFDLIWCWKSLQKQRVLRYLNNQGEVNKNRSLIIIDALNENSSNAPNFWKDNIDYFIEELKKYPHIWLIVSVRVGFETQIFTRNQEDLFLNIKHEWLKFKEREAVNKFFQEFDLPLPEVPLLTPEFQNPLFLMLYCSAFWTKNSDWTNKSRSKSKNHRSHQSFTHIFEQFVLHSSEKLCDYLEIKRSDFDGAPKFIWNCLIKNIAEHLIINNWWSISEANLMKIISENFVNFDVWLFLKWLEINNLLVKVPIYSEWAIQWYWYRFPFQKFSDFLLTRYIFKKYETFYKSKQLWKNKETLKDFFDITKETGKFLTSSWNYWIIEALSVECPEQMKGVELLEVAPYLEDKYWQDLYSAFINSLIRRDPKSLNIKSNVFSKVIYDHIFKSDYLAYDFIDAIITTWPIVWHQLNGYWLHELLVKIPMPKRDSWWSSNFIRDKYWNWGAIDRLLQWSQLCFNKAHICDESISLCCIVLSWFLTTPNRYVRDRATKWLVSLLKERVHLLIPLLEQFKGINDVYILERLYCVTYWSLLFQQEWEKLDRLKDLWEYIYENIFKDGNPPAHILLRDYANCSIQHITGLWVFFEFWKTIPPYNIKPISYPDKDDLKEKYYPYDKDEKDKKGVRNIWWSVMSWWDFERYTIASKLNYRSGYTLDNELENKKEIYNNFLNSLNEDQKELYWKISTDFVLHYLMRMPNDTKVNIVWSDGKKYKEDGNDWVDSKLEFKKSLWLKQLSIFELEIEPYLSSSWDFTDPYERVSLENAKNWIFNRIIELWYSASLHGEYDDNIAHWYYNRDSHKTERIWKKYQWIAYHEFLAKMADYYKFNGGQWRENQIVYEDYKWAWNPRIRDIDISFLLQDDSHLKKILNLDKWEQDNMFFDLSQTGTHIDWIKDYTTIPKIEPLIEIIGDNQKQWLLLEWFYKREWERLPEDDKYDFPVREIWYVIKSYLVKKTDSTKFKDWLEKQDFIWGWMPESHDFCEVFLWEYPNSEAFEDVRGNYNIDVSLDDKHGSNWSIDVNVIVTDDAYSLGSWYDCWVEESVSIKLPSKWIIEWMELIHKDINWVFYDKNWEIVSFCNQIFSDMGRSGVLIDKEKFIDFLEKSWYVIYWTVLWEKQMIWWSHSTDDYIWRLELSGSYCLWSSNRVEWLLRHKFTTR